LNGASGEADVLLVGTEVMVGPERLGEINRL
jgi:hypothetical protein